ncbi:peptidoglycan-binding protein [Devosia sp. 1566]|uniref:peptidoglycan-binding protein n=1 Tax=Devosia sp. 1566 TaxID=2499144 RepID=UPI0019D1F155|nr:peptidoglycan-binding protein [Devosia sp. 1566]
MRVRFFVLLAMFCGAAQLVSPAAAQSVTEQLVGPADVLAELPEHELVVVQQALAAAGFDVGSVDGILGPKTRAAVRSYQSSKGIQATGLLSIGEAFSLVQAWGGPDGVRAIEMGTFGDRLVEAYFSGEPFDDQETILDVLRNNDVWHYLLKSVGDGSRARATVLATSERYLEFSDLLDLDSEAAQDVLSALVWTYQQLDEKAQARWEALTGGQFDLLHGAIAEANGDPDARGWYERAAASSFARQRITEIDSGDSSGLEQPDCAVMSPAPKHADVDLLAQSGEVFRAGEPVKLVWMVPNLEQACVAPSYLVVAMPSAVRFEGGGFYVLAPHEPAPFGISFANESMRVVVPLHLMRSAVSEATLRIFQLGTFDVRWTVVEAGEIEAAFASDNTSIVVTHGSPSVVIQDPFPAETPIDSRVSPDGEFELRQFRRHYDIISRSSGSLVYTGDGYDARFSPTGRFVHSFRNDDSQFQVVDVSAAELVFELNRGVGASRGEYVQAVGWSAGDSFLVLGFEAAGGIGFLQTFLNRPLLYSSEGCGACDSWSSSTVVLDLENSLVSMTGWAGGWTPHSLAFDLDLSSSSRDLSLVLRHLVDPKSLPVFGDVENWNMSGRPRYTYNAFTDPNPRPMRSSRGSDQAALADELEPEADLLVADVPEGLLRGVFEMDLSDGVNRSSRLEKRLADFGITVLPAGEVEVDVVDFEPSAYTLSTAAPAVRAGLIDASEGEALNAAAEAWHSTTKMCLVMRASSATVWSWRAGDEFYQVVQYICYESTGYIANGRAALLYLRDDAFHAFALGDTDGDSDFVDPDEGLDSAVDDNPEAVVEKIRPLATNERLRIFRPCDDLLAFVSLNRRLVLFDAVERAVRFDVPVVGADLVSEVRCLDGRNQLLQVNSDGQLFVRDIADGQLVVRGYYVDDELAWYDDSLAFDSTFEGARYVNLKFPGDNNLYRLDQFARELRRPGLLDGLSGGETVGTALSVTAPPVVSVGALASSAEVATLTVEGNSGAETVEVFRDGMPVLSRALGADPRAAFEVPLLPETRWITVRAQAANGLYSAAVSTPVAGSDAAKAGRLFYVGLGTDTYSDQRLEDLDFAVSDASSLQLTLETAGSTYYRTITGKTFVNVESFSEPLQREFDIIAHAATAEDTLVLYVSGHGVLGSNGELRLASGATDLDDIEETSLSVSDLATMLDGIPSRVFIFLDVCHAGAIEGVTNDNAVEQLLQGTVKPVVIMSASKGRQFSREGVAFGGGAFTSALKAILTDLSGTDFSGNGTLELSEIYPLLKSQVIRQTAGQQTPWIARSDMPGEIPVF